jgi:chaperone BCS1
MLDGAKNKGGGSRSMNIVCKSVEARNAVLEEISKESQYLVESQPRMYVSSRWGDWRKRAEIQPRSQESVILKDGQMERILGYLNKFLSNRDAYKKADIPFRTGILLYGEPGSGKSSTALAIANELKMNVYIIALSSLLNDESLNDCFSGIPANSIIILEDIDVASAVKERDGDDDKGVTMSGMLNVLDGFQSPPGVITIMTTNRKDVLDPAIIRPGRVDLEEELNCLDNQQLEGLCKYFMGIVPEDLPFVTPEHGITSAEVMGVVRKHLPDFENAGPDMVEFIQNKVNDSVLTKLTV